MREPDRNRREKVNNKVYKVGVILLLGFLMIPLAPARAQLSGTIEIDGSSTVGPISEEMAFRFKSIHPDVTINVAISGTGGGFQRFVTGETDINDASRPIRSSENASAISNGVKFVELRVAIDGLAVMVDQANDWIHSTGRDCVTTLQLKRLFHPNATTVDGTSLQQPNDITQWNQINSSWPANPIRLFTPGTDSGTFDYFTQVIVGQEGLQRLDNPIVTTSENDNVLVQGINGTSNSLGYFGVAYYLQNTDKLKLLGVDSGSGCVKPTRQNILDSLYTPLSRPLFIYVNTARNNDTSQGSIRRLEVYEFVKFYNTEARDTDVIQQVGYVEYEDQLYNANLAAIAAAVPVFPAIGLALFAGLALLMLRAKRRRAA